MPSKSTSPGVLTNIDDASPALQRGLLDAVNKLSPSMTMKLIAEVKTLRGDSTISKGEKLFVVGSRGLPHVVFNTASAAINRLKFGQEVFDELALGGLFLARSGNVDEKLPKMLVGHKLLSKVTKAQRLLLYRGCRAAVAADVTEISLGSISEASSEDRMCAICIEEYDAKSQRALACGHAFHSACVEKWLTRNDTCPLCKAQVEGAGEEWEEEEDEEEDFFGEDEDASMEEDSFDDDDLEADMAQYIEDVTGRGAIFDPVLTLEGYSVCLDGKFLPWNTIGSSRRVGTTRYGSRFRKTAFMDERTRSIVMVCEWESPNTSMFIGGARVGNVCRFDYLRYDGEYQGIPQLVFEPGVSRMQAQGWVPSRSDPELLLHAGGASTYQNRHYGHDNYGWDVDDPGDDFW